MHKGVCVGGPLAGQTVTIRSLCGFVAVDRPGHAAWIYYTDDAGRFVLDVTDDPSLLDADGTRALDLDRLEGAITDKGLDVMALPGDGEDDEPEPGEIERIPDAELDAGDAQDGDH